MRLMNGTALSVLLGAAVVSTAAAPVQQTAESFVGTAAGDGIYVTYCSSCHGRSARGDGALADSLRVRPPDLTQLARRNKGTFDADRVRKAIDGRDLGRTHAASDMPVWGDAFKNASEGYSDKAVKARIDSIVDYLKTIQVKDKPPQVR